MLRSATSGAFVEMESFDAPGNGTGGFCEIEVKRNCLRILQAEIHAFRKNKVIKMIELKTSSAFPIAMKGRRLFSYYFIFYFKKHAQVQRPINDFISFQLHISFFPTQPRR